MKQGTGGWVLGLAAAGLLAAQAAQAQTNKAPGDVYLKYLDERLQRMVAELSLTDEQKAKLKAINDEEAAAMAKWNAEHQAIQAEQSAALRGRDEAARHKAGEAMRAASERRAAITTGSSAKIRAVLTDAKWQTWQVSELAGGWFKRFQAANLTAEQKNRIREACTETIRAQESSTNAMVRAEASRKFYEKVNGIVTPQQREDMAADGILERVMRNLSDVELTAEQKSKIGVLCRDAAKGSATGTDYRVRPAKTREVFESVKNTILTEAQRAKLVVPSAPMVAPPGTAPAPATPAPKTP